MRKYYYNGVLLPEIPRDILAEYPNVFIYKWADDGTINFMAAPTNNKWYYDSSNQQIRIAECSYKRYTYNTVTDAWELRADHTDNGRWGTKSDVGSVVWTNNTIPSGSVDSTTAWMNKCCVYEHTTGKLDYNGVMLPPIPTEHIGTNPYVWIRQNGSTGYYDLVMGADCWYYNSGLYCTSSATIYYYRIPIASADSATEWTYYKETTGSFGVDGSRPVLWSLQDVSSSIYSASVYFAGTDIVLSYSTKYLVRDSGKIYTVTDGALVEVTGTLNADMFKASGIDTIPDGALLMTLSAPEVLCWTNTEELPRLSATVQGMPTGTHEVISDNIPIGNHSIYGMASIDTNASENATFLLSFDGGEWMAYTDNKWSASSVGMTASELELIPTNAWSSVMNSAKVMRLKAMIDGTDTVTEVKFNFNNNPVARVYTWQEMRDRFTWSQVDNYTWKFFKGVD